MRFSFNVTYTQSFAKINWGDRRLAATSTSDMVFILTTFVTDETKRPAIDLVQEGCRPLDGQGEKRQF